ncbi:TPA: ABC-F family ATP-binding cassette domain-containing protein [Streptococcus suis]|nr:ABC-F family ATP-binding cassette domain-containing protein [Streptococcus suis]HEM5994594.1 ABC-F family ATP-binding cassette domain-containing protein [Streptococcus suis]HEM6014230.1 ABC-F family ATP-binding cassette domain-containing protein [Streptococcus suis]HEM6015806.1 ABC-F family ATP-binding cassette domain-containing protein [Streptococcus suis]HEM6378059.1 ABC-F family ATP-binding cassette domain-containing protein [Streptococcus suis]
MSLQAGQKVGLVGNNGVGKSTFLKILLGLDRDFAGQFEVKADWAYVPQLQERSSLSGGEQVWKSIQEAFAQRPQLLIMDEPTANLDQEHQEKLIKQIKRYRGSLLVVSHDRHFLNQIASHIWHLEEGTIQVYPGNYEAFVESRRARREGQQDAYEAYQKKVAQLKKAQHERRAKAQKMGKKKKGISSSEWKVSAMMGSYDSQAKSMAKTAKHLEKRIERLDKVEQPRKETWVKMESKGALDTGLHSLFRLQAGQLWIEETYLFDFPQLGMTFGDKLALVGSNGTGKTSFVRKLISKELKGYYNPKLKIAYFSQDLTSLNEEETAFVNASSTSLQDRVTVLNLLGMLGLSYDKSQQKVANLSGGERVRLSLAKVLLTDANLLILDEPTNFLDLTAIEALERFLKEYQGSVLVISHDQDFVDKVAKNNWRIRDGSLID